MPCAQPELFSAWRHLDQGPGERTAEQPEEGRRPSQGGGHRRGHRICLRGGYTQKFPDGEITFIIIVQQFSTDGLLQHPLRPWRHQGGRDGPGKHEGEKGVDFKIFVFLILPSK